MTLFGRQSDMPSAVKLKHQASAHHIFKRPVGLNPIPGTAKLFRQDAAAVIGIVRD
jgi:hypothetical protein